MRLIEGSHQNSFRYKIIVKFEIFRLLFFGRNGGAQPKGF